MLHLLWTLMCLSNKRREIGTWISINFFCGEFFPKTLSIILVECLVAKNWATKGCVCVRERERERERETFSSWMASINFPASSRYLNFIEARSRFLNPFRGSLTKSKKATWHRWRTMPLDHIWVFSGRRASSSVYLSRQSSSSMARYNIGFSWQGGFECNARLYLWFTCEELEFAWYECIYTRKIPQFEDPFRRLVLKIYLRYFRGGHDWWLSSLCMWGVWGRRKREKENSEKGEEAKKRGKKRDWVIIFLRDGKKWKMVLWQKMVFFQKSHVFSV